MGSERVSKGWILLLGLLALLHGLWFLGAGPVAVHIPDRHGCATQAVIHESRLVV